MGNPDGSHATLTCLNWGRSSTSRIAALVALALFGACGHFGSSGSAKTTDTTTPGEIGAGLSLHTTPTNAPTTTAKGRTVPSDSPCGPTHRGSEIAYGEGIKLAFTVSTICPVHADDITFSLTVTNTSSSVVHYDSSQFRYFTLKAPRGEQRRRWEDTDCHTPPRSEPKPASSLAPGQSLTITGIYPAPASESSRESCRRLEVGAYDAQGEFDVCGAAAYTDGYCDTAKDTQYFAEPIRVTVQS